jgi:hypothetical protein
MKKRRVLLYLFYALWAWVIVDIALEETKRESEMIAFCAYAAVDIGAIKLSKPAPAAQAAVRWIAATAGMSVRELEIYAASDVAGTALAGVKDGKRIIIYDAKRFAWGENTATFRGLCTIAHEVGHHLGSHPFLGSKPHDAETEADYFAGFSCAVLGGSLAQALAFTEDMQEADSPTHPGKATRQATVTAGWTRGDALKRTGKATLPAFASAAP